MANFHLWNYIRFFVAIMKGFRDKYFYLFVESDNCKTNFKHYFLEKKIFSVVGHI